MTYVLLPSSEVKCMRNRRIVLVLVTFLVSSAVASPLLSLLQVTTGADPEVLRFPTFATAVGAAVVWLIWRKTFTFPPQPVRSEFLAVVLSVFLAAMTAAVLFALNATEGDLWPPLDSSSVPISLAVILFLQLLGAVGEEVGWRGVVQPLLENRFSVVWSGIFTGLLFGLGHFYVLFAAGPIVYLTFAVAAIGLSVTLAVLTAGRSLTSRVLVASFFHWLVNSAMLVFFSGGDESLLWTINTAIATVVVAIAAVLLLRRVGQRNTAKNSSVGEPRGTATEPAPTFRVEPTP
ncbi:CPBP family intramembrane metalloprotease [Cryobacterium algoricola]|uniref:CPBP family intramembrane metalloprotease n=1 Tax=Cryobacterium algoricola TaxID=1259183 RepID=A0ABY2ID33_9MICO|nr:type II CAAX endopeptidase family protein [Cryobacterium algoricola]TFB87504.1 CPBP family intramembrane metalloprotease [Cryobacterium algoricola]